MQTTLKRSEFLDRVAHNSRLIQQHKKTLDLAKYNLYDYKHGSVPAMSLLSKANDIFPAAALGGLAFFDRNGADAVVMKAGRQVEIEIKYCTLDHRQYQINARSGKIFRSSERGHKAYLDRTIRGGWVINSPQHLETKARYSVLVMFDTASGEFVEALGMSGESVVELIGEKVKHKLAKKTKSSEVVSTYLYLPDFLAHGRPVQLTVNKIGLTGFAELVEKNGAHTR